jgi:hypothetical protein
VQTQKKKSYLDYLVLVGIGVGTIWLITQLTSELYCFDTICVKDYGSFISDCTTNVCVYNTEKVTIITHQRSWSVSGDCITTPETMSDGYCHNLYLFSDITWAESNYLAEGIPYTVFMLKTI